MNTLVEGFRLRPDAQTAVVGAGGKTTAVFHLARALPGPVWAAAGAHMGVWQLGLADRHVALTGVEQLPAVGDAGVGLTLFTGELDPEKQRTRGVEPGLLERLSRLAAQRRLPLVIEADGARRRPLKAPAAHEPPIPPFVDSVIVVAGLSALGKPLDDEHVYGAERFAALTGLELGAPLTAEALARALAHPQGGLKNSPAGARRLALFNQADAAPNLLDAAQAARSLLSVYDAAALASIGAQPAHIEAVYEPAAAILLAAGGSTRMGAPKLLLEWRGEPVVRHSARLALASGAQQAIVVVGAHAAEVESALAGLPVRVVFNSEWHSGQASSLAVGLREAIAARTAGGLGAALFLLGDQPQIPAALPQTLLEHHARSHPAILAPFAGGRRANPVLFDRVTFADLLALRGDEGGRQVMQHYPVEPLAWGDESILWDLDSPGDYERLKRMEDDAG